MFNIYIKTVPAEKVLDLKKLQKIECKFCNFVNSFT